MAQHLSSGSTRSSSTEPALTARQTRQSWQRWRTHWWTLLCAAALGGGVLLGCDSGEPDYRFIASDAPEEEVTPTVAQRVRVNQVGFYPQGPKRALVIGGDYGRFSVLTEGALTVAWEGTLSAPTRWDATGERVQVADFSDLVASGRYVISVEGVEERSAPFAVAPAIYAPLGQALVQAYYSQRASTPIEAAWVGDWARAAGHADDQVIVHPSAAGPARQAGDVIASPGGWYDAGDYGKYIVSSAFAVHALLAFAERWPEAAAKVTLSIPESTNATPDLLDETRWNLDWMLTMQDPADGGVYHKLVTPTWPGVVMPAQDVQARYVVRKTTAATLTFCASMAQASRVFLPLDPDLSGRYLAAAARAWEWAQANPDVRGEGYGAPEVSGGPYEPALERAAGGAPYQDARLWAALELYAATADPAYLAAADDAGLRQLEAPLPIPTWSEVSALGLYALAVAPADSPLDAQATDLARALLRETGAYLRDLDLASPARVGLSPAHFAWGSNGIASSAGMLLITAYSLDPSDDSLRDAAIDIVDYLLGRNGTGFSYVTGFGLYSPKQPHHRISAADGVAAPVPGWLVGGPNPGQQDSCPGYLGDMPANSWVDDWCSYASNEVAINWNAPAASLILSVEAALSGPRSP
jgi:endoglucanase